MGEFDRTACVTSGNALIYVPRNPKHHINRDDAERIADFIKSISHFCKAVARNCPSIYHGFGTHFDNSSLMHIRIK